MPRSSGPALPRGVRRSLLLYNFCFPFVFFALLPSFLVRLIRRGAYRDRFGQRLGCYSAEVRERLQHRGSIWIHSISVGETLVALKLARQLQQEHPGIPLILSTTTSTGFALARQAESPSLEATYNPIDFLPAVKRTLDALRPRAVILIEGEAWPNLLAESRRRRVPVVLANARLSPRSERRFRRFRAWTGPIFRMLEAICVSEEDDVQRWQSLGVERERIRRTGSIKFDESAGGVSRVADFRDLLAPLGVTPETPIVVAGSTHAGEELILGRIFVALREEFPDLLLIIVPRHVERTGDILRELGSIGVVIARRTELSGAGHRPDILLVDTTGELRDWYSLATAVFVGKSLTSIGGQNPAEPAALGRAVVVGPHMENFAAVVDLLLRAGGLAQIQDEGGLASELRLLLRDSPLRESRAAAAQAALTTHKGATARTSEVIAEVLRGSSVHSDASVRLD